MAPGGHLTEVRSHALRRRSFLRWRGGAKRLRGGFAFNYRSPPTLCSPVRSLPHLQEKNALQNSCNTAVASVVRHAWPVEKLALSCDSGVRVLMRVFFPATLRCLTASSSPLPKRIFLSRKHCGCIRRIMGLLIRQFFPALTAFQCSGFP